MIDPKQVRDHVEEEVVPEAGMTYAPSHNIPVGSTATTPATIHLPIAGDRTRFPWEADDYRPPEDTSGMPGSNAPQPPKMNRQQRRAQEKKKRFF